jgi:hypothetical protein
MVNELEINMLTSNKLLQHASDNGFEVYEPRMPESLPFVDFAGFPRVDVKTLIEQSRRRQAQESLLDGEYE